MARNTDSNTNGGSIQNLISPWQEIEPRHERAKSETEREREWEWERERSQERGGPNERFQDVWKRDLSLSLSLRLSEIPLDPLGIKEEEVETAWREPGVSSASGNIVPRLSAPRERPSCRSVQALGGLRDGLDAAEHGKWSRRGWFPETTGLRCTVIDLGVDENSHRSIDLHQARASRCMDLSRLDDDFRALEQVSNWSLREEYYY